MEYLERAHKIEEFYFQWIDELPYGDWLRVNINNPNYIFISRVRTTGMFWKMPIYLPFTFMGLKVEVND